MTATLPKEIFDQLRHLPDPGAEGEHHKKLWNVYGCMTTDITEKFWCKKPHRIPFSLSVQTARTLVLCSECLKPQVEYSRKKLKIWHCVRRTCFEVQIWWLFTCGSSLSGLEVNKIPIYPSSIQSRMEHVFVRESLHVKKCGNFLLLLLWKLISTFTVPVQPDIIEGGYHICQYFQRSGRLPSLF